MSKKPGKYGIPHHTIKYWQDQAKTLYMVRGLYRGRAEVENPDRYSGRELGHAIISLAAVASPKHVIAALTRTRRGRWIV
jgi:hypothetical protein